MLVKFRELTVDLIAGREHHRPLLQGIVDGIAAAVGHPAVGITVTGAPLDVVTLAERVFARELGIIGESATVVVFGPYLMVRLGIDALAVGIALVDNAVHDILQFIFVATGSREQGEVEQCSYPPVVVILVVGALAQEVAAVVGGIIYAEEIVGHVGIAAVFLGEVGGTHHSHLHIAERPAPAPVGTQFQVAYRLAALHPPVIVQSAALEPHFSVLHIAAAMRGSAEVAEMCGIVPVAAHRHGERVGRGDILGIDLDETTREVSGIFGTGRLHDNQIVYLAAGDEVEGEGA